jgi:uncharacterized protein YbbC (DUF1343 family)
MVNALTGFNITWIYQLYHAMRLQEETFITSDTFFDKLAGSRKLRQDLASGVSLADIEQSWKSEIKAYQAKIEPYLLYHKVD